MKTKDYQTTVLQHCPSSVMWNFELFPERGSNSGFQFAKSITLAHRAGVHSSLKLCSNAQLKRVHLFPNIGCPNLINAWVRGRTMRDRFEVFNWLLNCIYDKTSTYTTRSCRGTYTHCRSVQKLYLLNLGINILHKIKDRCREKA